jgi:hypothetical protein
MEALRIAVILAGLGCLSALIALFFGTRAYGKRHLFSVPAGEGAAGVRYAFIQGMAPQAKESVRMNLPSYAAGMLYHSGVFAAFGLLGLRLTKISVPGNLLWGMAILALAGALGGLILLIKRLAMPLLRGLSSPDDFVSNALATAFALLAGLTFFTGGLEGIWLLETALLLVYIPMGKIRHCLFFFPTRYHFGAFFGRRGVLPGSGPHHG